MSVDEVVFEPQVPREHYFKGYDTKERFISYWYQIDEVLRTEPKNVLEIGVGNKTVSNYLKNMGVDVTTVDVDLSLGPDHVCSVTDLSSYFEIDSFDTVLCAEVLEHLPFDYFQPALDELKRVAKNFVILSLPHFGIKFSFGFKIPFINYKQLVFKLPYPKEHFFDGEHYWEIGKRGYPIKSIEAILSKSFNIDRRYLITHDAYHMMFILRVGVK